MKKYILILIYIIFINQNLFAKENISFSKSNIDTEAKKYGLKIDEWNKSSSLMVTFDSNLESTNQPLFPVTLGLKIIPSSNIKNCSTVLNASFLQDFQHEKKIGEENGIDIYLIEPPTNSKLSSVFYSYKKGKCIGMYGSAGRGKNEDNTVRLNFFKKIIREY